MSAERAINVVDNLVDLFKTRPSFAALAKAGFAEELLPIIPFGAALNTKRSTLTPDKIGKVPGDYDVGTGLWCGLGKWTKRTFTDADRAAWETWAGVAIGLRTKYFPAIDVDLSDQCAPFLEKIKARIETDIGKAPSRGRRNAARCLWLFRLAPGEQPFTKGVIKFTLPGIAGEQLIEFLGEGQQFVGWGQHKSGAVYMWDRNPVHLGADNLPAVTLVEWQRAHEIIREEIAKAGGTIVVDGKTGAAGDTTRFPIPSPETLVPGFDGNAYCNATTAELKDTAELIDKLFSADPTAGLKDHSEWFRRVAGALWAIPNSNLLREDWERIGRAAKAAVGGDEAFFDLVFAPWCETYTPEPGQGVENSPEGIRSLWDSHRDSSLGWDYLRSVAQGHGWSDPGLEFDEVSSPDVTATAGDAAVPSKDRKPGAPLYMMRPETIPMDYDVTKEPPFDWVLGCTALAGDATLIIGPPGSSKSMLALARAISIITGLNLTGEPVHKRGAVLVYDAEDRMPVLRKRVAAICKHHDIPLGDVVPHLYLASGKDERFVVLKRNKDSLAQTDANKHLIEFIRTHNIIHCALDPLINIGIGVKESVNEEMEQLATLLLDIAAKTNVSLDIVHHTPKSASANHGDLNAARGAGSIGAAVRCAITIMPVEEDEVKKLGLHGRVFRVQRAKANFAPPSDAADLFRLVSVPLGNACTGEASDDIMPGGDTIGVHELIPQSEIYTGRQTAAEETRRKVLSTLVNAMTADEMSLKSLLSSVQSAVDVEERQAREEINEALPIGETKRIEDSAGALWKLERRPQSEKLKAKMIIYRKRIINEEQR